VEMAGKYPSSPGMFRSGRQFAAWIGLTAANCHLGAAKSPFLGFRGFIDEFGLFYVKPATLGVVKFNRILRPACQAMRRQVHPAGPQIPWMTTAFMVTSVAARALHSAGQCGRNALPASSFVNGQICTSMAA
jgi:hypothetical protein